MPAELIDGAVIARTIRGEAAATAAALTAQGVQPGLAVVLVGDDPASAAYVRSKARACEEAGMYGITIPLSASTTQPELLDRIAALARDPAVHGILVQMPLPAHLDPDAIIAAVPPEKDVDGFHPVNVGKCWLGDRTGFVPCTPAGVRELLVRSGVETAGAECVIVGRSAIVGKPMAALLLQHGPGGNATVTVCHSGTRHLAAHTRRADVLIVAAGRPHLITGEMVRPGATVIDVGITRVADPSARSGYRLAGDVDFDAVREVAGRITPVPGGVGPMTIAMLLANTVQAAARAAGAAGAAA